MTIQEEIRDRVIANIAKACPEMLNADIVKLADKILQGEASQGVVIKVDRELPNAPPRGYPVHIDWRDGQKAMLKAGCGFFEPLV